MKLSFFKKTPALAVLIICLPLIFQSCDDPIIGCTDPTATNYNPDATESDNTCLYTIVGCTDPTATNYNPDATESDNTLCTYPLGYNVRFKVAPHVNGVPFEMNTPYINAANQRYQIAFFRCYLSRITLIAEDNSAVELAEVVLYDFSDADPSIKVAIPAGNYKAIHFDVGLDEALNNTDPVTVAADHPLSWNQGTYWSWIKYRFIMMEGKVDADPSANTFEYDFAYHTGLDVLHREIALTRSLTVPALEENTVSDILVNLDIQRIFGDAANPLDMIENNVTHSEGDTFPLAELITNNFVNGLE